jgi:predicted TIM-barrel enzyme
VTEFLSVADGVIVGSDLKVDGDTWNPVEPERAERFMTKVREARAG